MNAPISALFTKSKSLVLALVVVLGAAQSPALAAGVCSDIFESRYDGLLQNRAARAAMLFKLKAVLPEGRHNMVDESGNQAVLGISYSPIGEAEVRLSMGRATGSELLVRTQASDRSGDNTLSPLNNIYRREPPRMQLLDGNRLVLANSQVQGNYLSIEGLRTRDIGVQFEFLQDGAGKIQITETVTVRSQYRPNNETYTIRRIFHVAKPGPESVVVVK